ncbi:RIO1 family regulatory kinase/ATPase domain-containing protein [Corallococcus silvisoli]|uniref:RIO1 family regulatory kinase/ATPase domain-containing protein n=1 Tax=Corallococcus silvisoli TaxID=2697031 RepID=UPI0013778A6D|nr:RIO1 family regulatory kinase/ATPase [Corallococcus silvisoli]NBD08749.1 hypothetical protein [Corallococcus silvisoli]
MNDSLENLLADGIIDAVIGQLKTGKEAEVWLVQHAGQVVAAKLYKERHERNFRNNAGYKEGREVRNSRTRRAMEKGSRFGQAAAEEAWKNAEADSLYKLHAQGVRVPTPVLFYEGILLMELVLDEQGQPAPRLVEAPPRTPEEAEALYLDLRAQVIRTLCADLIHGDLSPYNILMSGVGPTLIDFPQTVAAARNSQAEFYFRRDLDNVRQYLEGFSHRLMSRAGDTGEIWNAYVRRDLTPEYVPSGTFREAPRRQGGAGRQGFRQEERRNELRPQPAPVAAVEVEEGLSAEEAELRALEALVLRQGGGERGRPVVTSSPRDGRRRGGGFSGKPPPRNGNAPRPGGAGPQQNAGARPSQGAGANRPNGNAGRPPQGGPRAGNGAPSQGASAPVAQGDARANGRPQQGGPRDGGPRRDGRPPRQQNGEARANGQSQPPQGERSASGPRQNGEARANGQSQPPQGERSASGLEQTGEPRLNGQSPRRSGQQRQNNPSQPPNGERGVNGQRQRNGEPRMDGQPEQGVSGQRQRNGEPRMGGQSARSEQGVNGQRQRNGEPRMNGQLARSEQGVSSQAPRMSTSRSEQGVNGPPSQPEPGVSGPPQRQNGRPPRTEWRANGRPPPQNGEPRQNGPGARSRNNEPRTNGQPLSNDGTWTEGAPRKQGDSRPDRAAAAPQGGEPRMNGRPPRNTSTVPDAAPAQNGEPRQGGRGPSSGPREARGNTPRMPRQGSERGGGRPSRGAAPQVSYVGRPPASHGPETGSS